ncbi:Uncharacterised protein [Enterobacter hormaechei]|nr:Uncharacterised protein [Enterobacter hormaechei]VAF50205.1 Uncharacterised protein [Enterobacter hormaechei]
MLLLICENHQPRLGAGQVLCFPLKTNVNFGSLRDLLTVFTSCLKALSLSISALIIITLCLNIPYCGMMILLGLSGHLLMVSYPCCHPRIV